MMEDFSNIPIAKRGGVQLYLRDIAEVISAVKDPESKFSLNFIRGRFMKFLRNLAHIPAALEYLEF